MNTKEKEETVKLPWHAHLASGWPLGLVAIGGLIGGACGGLAYGLSISVFRKRGSSPISYCLAIAIGLGCIALYFASIIGLAVAFPDFFGQ